MKRDKFTKERIIAIDLLPDFYTSTNRACSPFEPIWPGGLK